MNALRGMSDEETTEVMASAAGDIVKVMDPGEWFRIERLERTSDAEPLFTLTTGGRAEERGAAEQEDGRVAERQKIVRNLLAIIDALLEGGSEAPTREAVSACLIEMGFTPLEDDSA